MKFNLLEQNPWWKNQKLIENDLMIKEYEKKHYKFTPPLLKEFPKTNPGIYTLRGPRQIGKSTTIKLLIRKLLRKNIPPMNIFFFTVDLITNNKELSELIKQYLNNTNTKSPKYIFLDEITLVDKWQLSLKQLADLGLIHDCIIFVTGSSATDIRKGAERMPGRRGNHKKHDFVQLPLSFKEFLELMDKHFENHPIDLKDILYGKYNWKKEKLLLPEINKLFLNYLRTGGYPFIINSCKENYNFDFYKNFFLDILTGEFEQMGKNRTILKNITTEIGLQLTKRITINKLHQNIGTVGSHHTTKDYVKILADSFIISVLNFIDINNKKINLNKQIKLFASDSIFFFLFHSISHFTRPYSIMNNPQSLSVLVENVVLNNLIKKCESRLYQGLSELVNTFYWYSNSGKEIDFILKKDNQLYPIEVKYRNQIRSSNFVTMKRIFPKGILLTKDKFFQTNKITAVPVSVFLLNMKF
ncbi:MAG: ATP-binding protein [Candidatus Cloacimonetes bacterium]|nr:ATP-binding protein [Candidatus Cloacimonadota bacterium]MBS3768591.1 ATP-binding protein [Candidatus Cloacimonadota bacterium]